MSSSLTSTTTLTTPPPLSCPDVESGKGRCMAQKSRTSFNLIWQLANLAISPVFSSQRDWFKVVGNSLFFGIIIGDIVSGGHEML